MVKQNFIKDLTWTYLSTGLAAIFAIISLKIIATIFSENQFGAYLIVKRIGQIGFPILTLNLGMSLAKFIPHEKNRNNNWLLLTLTSLVIFFSIVFLITFTFRYQISKLFFGDSSFSFLFMSAIFYIFAYGIHSISSNYWRGNSNFKIMNLTNPLFHLLSIIIILVLIIMNINIKQVFTYYFVLYSTALISINIILFVLYGNIKINSRKLCVFINSNKANVKSYFLYGLSRLPNGFFYSSIFFFPIFLAQNYFSLKAAAYIGIIISVTNLFMLFGKPFNLLLLPKFSNYRANSNNKYITSQSQKIINFIFSIPFLLSAFLFLFSKEIIYIWFGEKYICVGSYLMFVSPAIGFFISYIIIRSILDGLEKFPYSNIVSIISLVSMGIGFLFFSLLSSFEIFGLIIAFGIGLSTLGITSIIILKIKTKIILVNKKNIISIAWLITVFLCFIILNSFFQYLSFVYLLLIKLIFSLMILFITFIIYRKLNYFWLNNIIKKFGK